MTDRAEEPTVLINLVTNATQLRGVERYYVGLLTALAKQKPPYKVVVVGASWQQYLSVLDALPGFVATTVAAPHSRLVRALWHLSGAAIRGREYDLLHLGNVYPIPIRLRRRGFISTS